MYNIAKKTTLILAAIALLCQQGTEGYRYVYCQENSSGSLRPLASAERGLSVIVPDDGSEIDLELLPEPFGIEKGKVSMQPDPTRAVKIVADKRLDLIQLEKMVFGTLRGNTGTPQLVSVPARLIPEVLARILGNIQVISLSDPSKPVNAYEYMIKHVDFVIFTPYIVITDMTGKISHSNGSVPWQKGETPSHESLRKNSHQPGKRVIYISLGSIINAATGKRIATTEDLKSAEVVLDAVALDRIFTFVEETAHREIMQLTADGMLPEEFLTAPDAVEWQEKAVSTVLLTALNITQNAFLPIGPADRTQEFTELMKRFVRAKIIGQLDKINEINHALGISKDDLGFGRFGVIMPHAATAPAIKKANEMKALTAI